MHTNTLKPFSSKRPLCSSDFASSPPAKRAKATPCSSAIAAKTANTADHSQHADIKDKLTTVVTITTRGPIEKHNEVRTVTLHIDLLAQKSTYLYRLALTSPTPEIKLLELDSAAFGVFAAWVYSGRVEFDAEGGGGGGDEGDILASVLECYVLAHEIQAQVFADAVLKAACQVSATQGLVFRNGVINDMYLRTSSLSAAATGTGGCALRRWIVDEWVWQYDHENLSELEGDVEGHWDLCCGFLFDVVVAQAGRIGRKAKKHQSPSKMVGRYFGE